MPYRPVAARAKLEATLLKVAHGKIKPANAIDALERLRFQWRGDETELKTLAELGKLYVANNRVRDGLNTMRLAVRHFSASDEARATAAIEHDHIVTIHQVDEDNGVPLRLMLPQACHCFGALGGQ